jgi:hypothetical protein
MAGGGGGMNRALVFSAFFSFLENLDNDEFMLRTKHQYSIEKPQEKYSTP